MEKLPKTQFQASVLNNRKFNSLSFHEYFHLKGKINQLIKATLHEDNDGAQPPSKFLQPIA
jgi:hypothetical protein